MTQKIKRYPFSMQKYAHDIELRKNVAFLAFFDLEQTPETIEAEALYRSLGTLLTATMDNCRDGKVAWLTGEELAFANETVAWAQNKRFELNQEWEEKRRMGTV